MSRLIEADILSKSIKDYFKNCIDQNKHEMNVIDINADIQDLLDKQPTYKTDAYVNQLRWERDVAISQLEELGIGFGEKIEDEVINAIKEVKKCV